MSLLDFIKQYHTVGAAAHRFGELAALVVAHVAWRRTNQPGYGVALHVLAHIDADHAPLIVKERLRKGLGKLCLADARRAKDAATDAEYAENLKVKEALVAKAEALLPIKDIKAAKKALRPIQDAWEEAGRVPRGAVRRIEGRMRAVEDAIREAENAEWRRTDPETKARAEGLAGQLQDAIAGLEKDLAAAQAAGDAKKIAEAEAALTARRAWLEQVLRSAKA